MPDRIVVENFNRGVDFRTEPHNLPAGSLVYGNNVIINRFGDVEKAKAWVKLEDLDTDSFGLQAASNQLHTWSTVAVTHTLPYVINNQVTPPAGGTLINYVNDSTVFDGTPFASLQFVDGGGVRGLYWGTALANFQFGNSEPWAVITLKNKMYGSINANFYFSTIDDVLEWRDDDPVTYPGSGLIDTGRASERADINIALGVYQSRLAVFQRDSIQIWDIDPDPDLYNLFQVVDGIGAVSRQAVASVGDRDILFLAESGIRSLRAQALTERASTQDVGSPVDDLVIAAVELAAGSANGSPAEIEPLTGGYFLAIGETIFCYFDHPSQKVRGWTTMTPGFEVEQFATIGQRLYARDTDGGLWVYGGDDGDTYDTSLAEAELPFIAGEGLTSVKNFLTLDVGCKGTWTVEASAVVDRLDLYEQIGTITDSTFDQGNFPLNLTGTHISLRLTTSEAARNRITKCAWHFNPAEAI